MTYLHLVMCFKYIKPRRKKKKKNRKRETERERERKKKKKKKVWWIIATPEKPPNILPFQG